LEANHDTAPGIWLMIAKKGSGVKSVTYDEAVALIERFVAEGGPHSVVTPNPEIVMLARRHADFRAILARSALAHLDAWTWLVAEYRTWLIVIATVIGIAAPSVLASE